MSVNNNYLCHVKILVFVSSKGELKVVVPSQYMTQCLKGFVQYVTHFSSVSEKSA